MGAARIRAPALLLAACLAAGAAGVGCSDSAGAGPAEQAGAGPLPAASPGAASLSAASTEGASRGAGRSGDPGPTRRPTATPSGSAESAEAAGAGGSDLADPSAPGRAAGAGGAPSGSPSLSGAAVAADRPLAGRVIVIDAGHNGGNGRAPAAINRLVNAGGIVKECDTVGATTAAGYPEHAFTFDVTRRAAALLRARGATVVLTRASDDGVGPCVDERARIGNRAHAAVAVSIHADGGPASGRGFHVIAPARSPDGGNAAIVAPSARLARLLRTAFGAATHEPTATYQPGGGLVVRADLGGLNVSRVPKVFIECGNMANRADARLLTSRQWRQQAAFGIAVGLAEFLLAGG